MILFSFGASRRRSQEGISICISPSYLPTKLMADAALSAFLQVVFQSLASPILKEMGSLAGIDKDLKKLSKTLLRVQAVLNDAEERQINEEVVRIWLRDLHAVAYDADDVLDEMATELLRLKMEAGGGTVNDGSQVSSFFSALNPNSNRVLFRLGLAPKIKDILTRLDEIAKERSDLRLREGVGRRRQQGSSGRHHTSSFLHETHVLGRQDDGEKMAELLVGAPGDGHQDELSVVSIVGMAGIGKTTLAQLVYNDERLRNHFDMRIWIHVSDEFDIRSLTKAIIESVTRKSIELMQLDPLQVTLEELVNGKRFFLVFDDVWNEKQGDWDALLCPLRSGAKGSKILVTTRSGLVSSIMGTISARHLEGLSEDDCWSLIKHRALVANSSVVPLELEAIGKEIAKRCGGLPLAAKTFGRLLRSKTCETEWDVISNSVLWELLPDNQNEILQSLRLSYHHLLAHLKRCFSYCSVFPKDHEYSKEKLVLLWVAEGFVQPRGRQLMEDVGYEYFHDLLSMSFFRYSHDDAWDGQPRYKMHGLIHELAQSTAGDKCYQMEGNQSFCKMSSMVRHASLICRNPEPIDFGAFQESKNLRTLLLLSEYRIGIEHVPSDLFSKLKCLRTLDLSGTNIKELPNSIGNLKHLRLLDLFGTRIKRLPESICSLYNLQNLNLKNCSLLRKLPQNTKNLINLRHLTFDTYSQLMPMPPGIGKLTRLQSLSAFAVGKESGCGVQELKNLVDLQGAICIWSLENAVNVEAAKEASLKNKPRLQKLTLGWSNEDDSGLREERVEEGIIENLQPHYNIKELRIEHYSGVGFPSWIGDRSYHSLVAISFYGCKRCILLPPLGQLPYLKHLFIDGMSRLKQVTRVFYGKGDMKGFLALETLHLNDASRLEEWCRVEEGEMGGLHQLTVSNCPKLGELPLLPFTLMKLYLRDCMGLNKLPMLPSLSDLELRNCDHKLLDSLPGFTALSSLAISEIRSLKHLPISFSLTLSSLKDLVIEGCHDLLSLFDENASRGFISLERLVISQCPQLAIVPGEGLPTTLTYLQMSSCANLQALPNELKKLTSLQDLEIWDCPQIAALPEDGLPTALQYLDIHECPFLEERCQKVRGKDWDKIAHIPRIWIAYEHISRS